MMAFSGNYVCDSFSVGLASGDFDFSATTTDVYKIALYTNSATLDASTASYTATGEASGTGYSAGGAVLTISVNPTTDVTTHTTYLSFDDVTWPGSSITARGALIYKFDGAANPAAIVLDFGADKTTVSQTFMVQFPTPDATSAIVRIAKAT